VINIHGDVFGLKVITWRAIQRFHIQLQVKMNFIRDVCWLVAIRFRVYVQRVQAE